MPDDNTSFETKVSRVVAAFSAMQESHECALVLTERIRNLIQYASLLLYYSAAERGVLEAWTKSGKLIDGDTYLESYDKFKAVRNKGIAHPNEGAGRLDIPIHWDWYRMPTGVTDALRSLSGKGNGPGFHACGLALLTTEEWLNYRDLASITAEIYLIKQYEIYRRMGLPPLNIHHGVDMPTPSMLRETYSMPLPTSPSIDEVKQVNWVPS